MKSPQAEPSSTAYGWYVVVVLTLAYVVSFLDRQILALMVEPIKRDLGLTDTHMSLLMGLAFGIFYTLMGVPLGRLADRRSRRGLIAAGVAVWCMMTAACGLARNFAQFFVARIGVGVGEAALTPSALSMIADYFPREKRGRAIGFYNMGVSLGVGAAMVLGGVVISYVMSAPPMNLPVVGTLKSWQYVFLLVGLPGLGIVALMATIREPPRQELLAGQQGAVSLRFAAKYLADRRRVYVPLFVGMSVVTIIGYAYFSWIPTMFIRRFGWTIRDVGISYGLLVLVCGPIGVNGGGWLADWLYRRGYRDAHLRTALIGALISLPTAALAPLMPTASLTLAMMIPASIGPAISTAAGASAVVMITPNQIRGQTYALYMFTISILSLTLGPTAVALCTDFVFGSQAALNQSIAIVCGVAAVCSVVLLRAGLAPYRQAVDEAVCWSG
jgi:MFS family permease